MDNKAVQETFEGCPITIKQEPPNDMLYGSHSTEQGVHGSASVVDNAKGVTSGDIYSEIAVNEANDQLWRYPVSQEAEQRLNDIQGRKCHRNFNGGTEAEVNSLKSSEVFSVKHDVQATDACGSQNVNNEGVTSKDINGEVARLNGESMSFFIKEEPQEDETYGRYGNLESVHSVTSRDITGCKAHNKTKEMSLAQKTESVLKDFEGVDVFRNLNGGKGNTLTQAEDNTSGSSAVEIKQELQDVDVNDSMQSTDNHMNNGGGMGSRDVSGEIAEENRKNFPIIIKQEPLGQDDEMYGCIIQSADGSTVDTDVADSQFLSAKSSRKYTNHFSSEQNTFVSKMSSNMVGESPTEGIHKDISNEGNESNNDNAPFLRSLLLSFDKMTPVVNNRNVADQPTCTSSNHTESEQSSSVQSADAGQFNMSRINNSGDSENAMMNMQSIKSEPDNETVSSFPYTSNVHDRGFTYLESAMLGSGSAPVSWANGEFDSAIQYGQTKDFILNMNWERNQFVNEDNTNYDVYDTESSGVPMVDYETSSDDTELEHVESGKKRDVDYDPEVDDADYSSNDGEDYKHIKKGLKKQTNIAYQCDICNITCQSAISLTRHKKKLHGDMYRCELCFKYFSSQEDFNKHMESHPNSPFLRTLLLKEPQENIKEKSMLNSTHECKTCGRTFKLARSLKNHIKQVHEREIWENYMRNLLHCPFCKQRFKDKDDLAAHVASHSGGNSMLQQQTVPLINNNNATSKTTTPCVKLEQKGNQQFDNAQTGSSPTVRALLGKRKLEAMSDLEQDTPKTEKHIKKEPSDPENVESESMSSLEGTNPQKGPSESGDVQPEPEKLQVLSEGNAEYPLSSQHQHDDQCTHCKNESGELENSAQEHTDHADISDLEKMAKAPLLYNMLQQCYVLPDTRANLRSLLSTRMITQNIQAKTPIAPHVRSRLCTCCRPAEERSKRQNSPSVSSQGTDEDLDSDSTPNLLSLLAKVNGNQNNPTVHNYGMQHTSTASGTQTPATGDIPCVSPHGTNSLGPHGVDKNISFPSCSTELQSLLQRKGNLNKTLDSPMSGHHVHKPNELYNSPNHTPAFSQLLKLGELARNSSKKCPDMSDQKSSKRNVRESSPACSQLFQLSEMAKSANSIQFENRNSTKHTGEGGKLTSGSETPKIATAKIKDIGQQNHGAHGNIKPGLTYESSLSNTPSSASKTESTSVTNDFSCSSVPASNVPTPELRKLLITMDQRVAVSKPSSREATGNFVKRASTNLQSPDSSPSLSLDHCADLSKKSRVSGPVEDGIEIKQEEIKPVIELPGPPKPLLGGDSDCSNMSKSKKEEQSGNIKDTEVKTNKHVKDITEVCNLLQNERKEIGFIKVENDVNIDKSTIPSTAGVDSTNFNPSDITQFKGTSLTVLNKPIVSSGSLSCSEMNTPKDTSLSRAARRKNSRVKRIVRNVDSIVFSNPHSQHSSSANIDSETSPLELDVQNEVDQEIAMLAKEIVGNLGQAKPDLNQHVPVSSISQDMLGPLPGTKSMSSPSAIQVIAKQDFPGLPYSENEGVIRSDSSVTINNTAHMANDIRNTLDRNRIGLESDACSQQQDEDGCKTPTLMTLLARFGQESRLHHQHDQDGKRMQDQQVHSVTSSFSDKLRTLASSANGSNYTTVNSSQSDLAWQRQVNSALAQRAETRTQFSERLRSLAMPRYRYQPMFDMYSTPGPITMAPRQPHSATHLPPFGTSMESHSQYVHIHDFVAPDSFRYPTDIANVKQENLSGVGTVKREPFDSHDAGNNQSCFYGTDRRNDGIFVHDGIVVKQEPSYDMFSQ